MVGIGALCALGAVFHGLNARNDAEKLLKGRGYHQTPEKPIHDKQPDQFVSRDEFALVDNLRVIAFLSLFLSFSILGLGKMALRAVRKGKGKFAHVVFKRSLFRVGVAISYSCN